MDSLVAPCGMDCSHCSGYLNREYGLKGKKRVQCAGCRARDKNCAFLKKRCDLLRKHQIDFCYECPTFPCAQLDKLEDRYRDRGYANSFIANNLRIKEIGPEAFLEEQKKRFACPECGGPISIHEPMCFKCGRKFP
jgi:hypothetical protein